MTNTSGNLTYRAEFDPYGKLLYEWSATPNQNTKKFTGYERDAGTGLDYAQARMYGSEWGRFMSPDPMGLASANKLSPLTLNRYSYAGGNPVNFVDPAGTDFSYFSLPGTGSIFGSWFFNNQWWWTVGTPFFNYAMVQPFASINTDIEIDYEMLLNGVAALVNNFNNNNQRPFLRPKSAAIGGNSAPTPFPEQIVGLSQSLTLKLPSCEATGRDTIKLFINFTKGEDIELYTAPDGGTGGTEARGDEDRVAKFEDRHIEVVNQKLSTSTYGGTLEVWLRLRGTIEEIKKANKYISFDLVGFQYGNNKTKSPGRINLNCPD